jgi:hypothetical protein
MDKIERAVDDIRRKWVPDGRLAVFEISIVGRSMLLLTGITSSRDARDALPALANDVELVDEIELIPQRDAEPAAIVTAALAPLLSEPRIVAPRVSEALHGEALDVLERREEWLRVRAPDGYIAWLNAGYVATGPTNWADDWKERASARSLSADIVLTDGRRRLPTGARVALRRGVVELADGQRGAVASGYVRRAQERASKRATSPPRARAEMVQRRAIPVGRADRVGHRLFRAGPSRVRCARHALPRDTDQQFGRARKSP